MLRGCSSDFFWRCRKISDLKDMLEVCFSERLFNYYLTTKKVVWKLVVFIEKLCYSVLFLFILQWSHSVCINCLPRLNCYTLINFVVAWTVTLFKKCANLQNVSYGNPASTLPHKLTSQMQHHLRVSWNELHWTVSLEMDWEKGSSIHHVSISDPCNS